MVRPDPVFGLPFPEFVRRVGLHILNLLTVGGEDLLLTSIKRQAEMIIMEVIVLHLAESRYLHPADALSVTDVGGWVERLDILTLYELFDRLADGCQLL